jgi:hypothetical protein
VAGDDAFRAIPAETSVRTATFPRIPIKTRFFLPNVFFMKADGSREPFRAVKGFFVCVIPRHPERAGDWNTAHVRRIL